MRPQSTEDREAGAEPRPADEFVPRRWLRSADLQTIASQFLLRKIKLPPGEERLFRVAEGVQVRCVCHWQKDAPGRMTALLVHGLEGSSESVYMVGCAHKALAAGMNVVRMNVRNCGGTESLSPSLYHSGLSGDIGEVARTLIAEKSLQRLGLIGFSMGGNLVLKLAGEWGREAPAALKAVATVCPSIELAASADALHRLRNRAYERYFLIKLKRRMRRKARLFPDEFRALRLRGLESIRDFDDKVTAQYCGFAGAADYYQRASALPHVERIAVPTLIIHAQDDPFILMLPRTREVIGRNPNIRFIETKYGGHCGFLAQPDGYDGRWAEQQVVGFLRTHE
jgi:uncharacterized protein